MSQIKLSVMILSLPNRLTLLQELLNELEKQSNGLPVEILYLGDSRSFPIGQKRNMLSVYAQGEYSCWVDDDDFIAASYIDKILTGIDTNPDVICWTNKVTVDGPKMTPHPAVHECHFSIKYNPEINDTVNKIYYHRPCHINPVRHSIALKHKFDECSYCRSDMNWAKGIVKDLKTEYIIPEIMYFHRYGFSNDKARAPKTGRVS